MLNYYMMDLLLWLSLLTGANCECGSEKVAVNSYMEQQLNPYYWGMYAYNAAALQEGELQTVDSIGTDGSAFHTVAFEVTDTTQEECKTLDYSLTQIDETTVWTDPLVFLDDTTKKLTVNINQAFGIKTLIMKATSPGGVSASITVNIIVVNQRIGGGNTECQYSIGDVITSSLYLDPTQSHTFGVDDFLCKFTSSESSGIECPLTYLLGFVNNGSPDGLQYVYPSSLPIKANAYAAGATYEIGLAVGIPSDTARKYLKKSSPQCTHTFYFCGKEVISLVAEGKKAIVKDQSTTSGPFVMSHQDLAALFNIDSSAADAYAGCSTIQSYALVQSDGKTVLTDETWISYASKADTVTNVAQGVTFKLDNVVANYQDAYIKITTKGGVSKTLQLDFTVNLPCGTENEKITTPNGVEFVEAIYATGTAGDTYTLTAKNYFTVTGSSNCLTLTYSLVDKDEKDAWTNSAITLYQLQPWDCSNSMFPTNNPEDCWAAEALKTCAGQWAYDAVNKAGGSGKDAWELLEAFKRGNCGSCDINKAGCENSMYPNGQDVSCWPATAYQRCTNNRQEANDAVYVGGNRELVRASCYYSALIENDCSIVDAKTWTFVGVVKTYVEAESNTIVINKKEAFEAQIFKLKATTPGGVSSVVQFEIMVTNPGCSYSHSGSQIVNEYITPTASFTYELSANPCKFTSTKTDGKNCPLYRFIYDSAGDSKIPTKTVGHTGSYTIKGPAAGTFSGPTYYNVGLPGNPLSTKSYVLNGASEVCTLAQHFCGLETITDKDAGLKVLKYTKSEVKGTSERIDLSVFEKWYAFDTSKFKAATGADWSGCKVNSYALQKTTEGPAVTNMDGKVLFDAASNILSVVIDTVGTEVFYLRATTVGGVTVSKKVMVEISENCGVLAWTATATTSSAMTNKLTVGSATYQIYEKAAVTIGAKGSYGITKSTEVTFINDKISNCPIATWKLTSSLTAKTSLKSGTASDVGIFPFPTDQPTLYNVFLTVLAADTTVTSTINYKIAVCGLEKVTVADTSEVKITKYFNEFKKDYHNLIYYPESIYQTWFSLDTASLVKDGRVANAIEADMFQGCPINDYMLCGDAKCAEMPYFYLDYQTEAKIKSDGSSGTDKTTTRRMQAAAAPQIPYTDPSFNLTKVTVRDKSKRYSRLVLKLDQVGTKTAQLAAITTGYAYGLRNLTVENKCGLEYIYPMKSSFDYQLQVDIGLIIMQAQEYQAWFGNSFKTACPIVRYEIRSYASAVPVDDKLADGTYLKFTQEYLTAEYKQGNIDSKTQANILSGKIPSVPATNQMVDFAFGLKKAYNFCHNGLTDAGVACTSAKVGGSRLDEKYFPDDDIMHRVKILSSGQIQLDTDGIKLEEGGSNIYQVDLVAISEGGAEAFAHVKLDFIAKREEANNLPFFESELVSIPINVVDNTTIQVYTSPKASDLDGDSVTIQVSGNIYPFIEVKTSATNFELIIDHSQITEDLNGAKGILKVELSDGNDTVQYSVTAIINWQVVVPESIPEPEKVIEEDVAVVEEEQKLELKEGEVEIGAETAEWQEAASADTMNSIFAGYQPPQKSATIKKDQNQIIAQDTEEEEEQEVLKPVKIKSDNSVSRDGIVKIQFNQKMKVPEFIDNGKSPEESRLLEADRSGNVKMKIPLSQLDVTRDICAVRFILASNIDPKDIKYFLQITSWDETGVSIFVNFTDPMLASRGEERDLLELTIKRPQLFISAETGLMVDTADLVFLQTIPRQLPKGVSEKSLKQDAEDIARILNSLAYVQISLSFVLKGLMADLMTAFQCLQLCCYFTIYKVNIPGNSEIYIDEFRKLIDMDAVKPDNILMQFNEEWSVAYFIGITKERVSSVVESSGMKSTNFVANMSTFLFIGAVALALIILMALLVLLLQFVKSRFENVIKEKLQGVLRKLFFNGQIKSMTISYLKTCLAFSAFLQVMDFDSMPLKEIVAQSVAPTMICVVYPFMCLFIVIKYRPHLSTPRFTKRISNMYEGVHLTRNNETIFYYPMYLIRRLIFVCLPVLFWFEITFSIQMLFFLNYAFAMFFFHAQPITDPGKNKMQMYNEFMIILITYHLFFFTDICNLDQQFTLGYYFIFTLVSILGVNVIKMVINSVFKYLSARRKKANQKAYEKVFNEWVEYQIVAKKNRKQDRLKKRLEKIEQAQKAMKEFKWDFMSRKNTLKQEASAAKKQGQAIDQLFSQTAKGNGQDLFAQRPFKRNKRKNQADQLQLALQKSLNLTKIQEQEGEEGTHRTNKDMLQGIRVDIRDAQDELDIHSQIIFSEEEEFETEEELTEEEILLNQLIQQLSFFDRVTYKNNVDLEKKYSLMEQQILDKRNGSKLSLKAAIDLLDSINQEQKRILPLEAIQLQHKKIIGDVEPQEQAQDETPDQQFDIYLTAIQIEIQQIKRQQDQIERKNKVGKYQHLKQEEKKDYENDIYLDALELEMNQNILNDSLRDSETFCGIVELPDSVAKKKNQVQNNKEEPLGADDVLIGAAIVGAHQVIHLSEQDLQNMGSNQNQNNTVRIVDPNEDVEVHEEVSASQFQGMMAKMKFMGAEGLVFAGLLDTEDLPPNPDEEGKDEDSEDEGEDEDSCSDEALDGEGIVRVINKKKVGEDEVEEDAYYGDFD